MLQIISPEKTFVSMMGSKIEIQLHKPEPGSWTKLQIPKVNKELPMEVDVQAEEEAEAECVDALDLDDLDLSTPKLVLSNVASGGRTDQDII